MTLKPFSSIARNEILAEMRLLTGEMEEVEIDFHGNEARAIEKFELRLRELIDSVLRKHDPGYWPHLKDGDLRGRIEERINDWLRQQPSRARNGYQRSGFLPDPRVLSSNQGVLVAVRAVVQVSFEPRHTSETHQQLQKRIDAQPGT